MNPTAYFIFWTVIGGLIYFQMSAVAAVIYENYRVTSEGLVLTVSERRLKLVKRTIWFLVLPLGIFWVIMRDSKKTQPIK